VNLRALGLDRCARTWKSRDLKWSVNPFVAILRRTTSSCARESPWCIHPAGCHLRSSYSTVSWTDEIPGETSHGSADGKRLLISYDNRTCISGIGSIGKDNQPAPPALAIDASLPNITIPSVMVIDVSPRTTVCSPTSPVPPPHARR